MIDGDRNGKPLSDVTWLDGTETTKAGALGQTDHVIRAALRCSDEKRRPVVARD